MQSFYDAVATHGPRVFSGAIPGVDFGKTYGLSRLSSFAERTGFHVEALSAERVLIFHKDIDGAFVLYTTPNGHVMMEAADAEDIHATE